MDSLDFLGSSSESFEGRNPTNTNIQSDDADDVSPTEALSVATPQPVPIGEKTIIVDDHTICDSFEDATNANFDDTMRIGNAPSSTEDRNNMFTKFAFPFKLHSILENSNKSEQEHIISWLPSGKGFKIHKPKEFARSIMPQYFNQTKYRSFQRQLYIYGFDRIRTKSSDDYGAYYHHLFVRGASDLCLDMQRKKIKGTGLSNEERRKRSMLSKSVASSERNQTPRKNIHYQTIVAAPQAVPIENETKLLTPSMLLAKHRKNNSNSSSNNNNNKDTCFTTSATDVDLRQFFMSNQQSSLQVTTTNAAQSSDLTPLMGQAQEQLTPRKVSLTQWENRPVAAAVIKSALQAQEVASRQQGSNNSSSIDFGILESMLGKKLRRRCSLGFIRTGTSGMSRRGSLLFDGDEVCFGNRKFYFTATSEY